MRKITVITFFLFFIISCTDKEEIGKLIEVEGKVEKGPFTQGSTVTMQELDANLALTGNSFQTDIRSNEGDFKFETSLEFQSQFAQIACDGYFFNEIEGDLSNSQIRLEAIVSTEDENGFNVNILTHLVKDRMIKLIKEDNYSYKNASLKASEELLGNFGLQRYKDLEFRNISITSENDNSGVLITISSILLYNRSEAEFTEYIASLKTSFTENGIFSDTVKEALRETSLSLDTENIRKNIITRYAELGKEITVPNLNYFIDWDGDGIAGNSLGNINENSILEFEKDTLTVGKEGGILQININSNVPYKLSENSRVEVITEQSFLDEPNIESEINNGVLILTIDPASSPFLKSKDVQICTYDESLYAKLTIIQEGDFSNEKSVNYLMDIISKAATAFDYSFTIEAFYSGTFSSASAQWQSFTNHNINASNSAIYSTWAAMCQLNHYLNIIEELTDNDNSSKYFASLRALLYYHFIVLWGDVPYVDRGLGYSDAINIVRTPANEIYSNLESILEFAIQEFSTEDEGSLFKVSNYIPKALLAKIFIQQKEYDNALILLQDIISSGNYSLNNSRTAALNTGSTELIYAIHTSQFPTPNFTNNIESNEYLPLLQYSEIILLAAECAYYNNDIQNAIGYLNQLRSRDGDNPAIETEFMDNLKESWHKSMKGGFSYFDFLKRNNIAESELNINEYKTLLPIPEGELVLNTAITQNPGY